jgi:ATP-dependent Lhr-like helicase
MFPNVYTDDQIGAHHSSVSREIRHEIEDKLKKGELKVCVCVDKNSEVLLSGGKWKKITALKDEKLITLNLETLKLESCKFKCISERNDKNIEGLLIKTSTGKEIKCTKEHKLLTINDGVLTWKNAENLKVGEFIATIRCNRTFSKNIPSYFEFLTPNVYLELSPFLRAKLKMELIKKFGLLKNATKHLGISYSVLKNSLAGIQHISYKDLNKVCNSLGISVQNLVQCTDKIGSDKRAIKLKQTNFSSNFIKFVGFLLSDGTFNKHSFAIFSEDRDLLENYTSLIKEEFNLNFTDIVNPYGISGKRSSSTLICGMLIKLGLPMKKKSINAIVPESFFSMPKDYVWEFLSGYFDGDGYLEVKSDGRVYSAGFVTFSKKMAEGLQKLLLKLGIISSIREREYNEKQKYRGRIISKKGTCYTVSVFGGEHLRKFAANINPFRKSHFRIKSVLRMKGHCNRDVIPNLGPILKKLRDELGLSTYFMQRNFKINPMKYEIGARNITRKKLLQLLGIYLNFGYNKTIEYLLKIANSDIFWDEIKEIKKIKLEKAYDIVDSGKFHNFIVNGIITKNSSTSLELGIDIGYIDQVIQLGSPKSITRLVQRVGRGGHTLEKTSVGRVIAMDRDDQVELAVMIQQAYKYFLDKIHIPQNCLDVLAQHLMGMSLEKKWNIREAFNLIRNSYCYRNLDWKTFLSVLEFLSGAYHSLEEKKVYGKIWVDFNSMMFGRRGKYARVIYSLNIGTIPDEVKIKVRTLDGRYIGSIEEEFLQRLLPGDIFVLAGKTYEFIKAREVTAYVRPVKEKRPTVPAWFSEMLPLSFELALKIQEFRGKMLELVRKKEKKEVVKWLLKNYYLDEWSANSIYEYFLWEYKFLKALGAKRFPDEKTILVENYVDERGNQNIIFHTLFGRRINDALSRAFGYLLTKRLKKSVGLTISDNGFVISIPCEPLGKGWLDIISLREKISRRESERIKPEEIVKLLKSENLKEVLRKALRQTELIKRRFRHCATRSLMILRNYKGYEIRVARQQFNADRLLRVCEKFENFPVVEETYREVMEDFMDVEHARWLLEQIEKGKIKYEFLPESNVPSPFAHNLIALGETDVVLMEDRKRLLLELHKKVMEKVNKS